MKKHIIGLTIFTFIVGSFAIVWSLFGFFAQTIPNVPKVESDNLPVFKSEKTEKLSLDIDELYYFVDTQKLVVTLKIKWNGYGNPPKSMVLSPVVFNADSKVLLSDKPQTTETLPNLFKKEYYLANTVDLRISKQDLKQNLYAKFDVFSESGEKLSSNDVQKTHQVIVVHGDSSIVNH